MNTERILRIPLPISLIREMDEMIAAGEGGLDSRADLAREAIEAMVMELRYGLAEPEAQPHQDPILTDPRPRDTADVSFTSLEAPLELSYFVEPLPPYEKPPRGFHNRDYPSLWAAAQLCRLLNSESMAFDAMADALVEKAWAFAERLVLLDNLIPGKPSALFPTNPRKRQSAESKFMMFAVGTLTSGTSGEPRPKGVLFAWKVLSMEMTHSGPKIGLTHIGRDLLDSMAGLTVAQPHPPEYTHRFLAHLAQHSPGDWEGFKLMMQSVSSGIGREKLIDAFNLRWSEWNRNVASTNAAGYIARGREWGLVEMGQVDRRYVLTELGQQVLSEQEASYD